MFPKRTAKLLPPFLILYQAPNQNDEDQYRQYILKIRLEPERHLETAACIDFRDVLIKAPAPLGRTEEQVDERACREQDIAHEEVFTVQDIAVSEEMHAGEHIVAENAGDGEDENDRQIQQDRFSAAPSEIIHAACDEILKDCRDRREARKGHEYKEERSPELAHGHVAEDLRKGDKNERRPLIRLHIIGEARRENDEPCHDSDEGIEHRDAHGLSPQRKIIRHVASEDLDRGDAEGQREEGLIHRGGCHIADTGFCRTFPVRKEVEGESRPAAFEEGTMHGKHDDERKKAEHHDLRDALYTALEPQSADEESADDRHRHEEAHFPGTCQHRTEDLTDPVRLCQSEGAIDEFPEISKHPAGYRRIVHHEQVAAQNAEPSMDMPLRARSLQCGIALDCAFSARAAHGKLHRHDGDAHQHQKEQVKEDEYRAAVFACHIGEFPYIPDPDRAPCTDQQKAQTGLEAITFIH